MAQVLFETNPKIIPQKHIGMLVVYIVHIIT